MELLLLEHLCKQSYKKFIRTAIRENTHLFFTTSTYFESEFSSLTFELKKSERAVDCSALIDQINLQEDETPACFTINYPTVLSVFDRFQSLLEFTTFYNICRICFIRNSSITIQIDVESKTVWLSHD